MKKQLILFFAVLMCACISFAQSIDSLQKALARASEDSLRLKLLNELGKQYMDSSPSKAFSWARQAEKLALKYNNKSELAAAYYIIGNCYDNLQSYPEALEYFYKALPLREEEGNKKSLIRLYNSIGILYAYQKDYRNALKYFLKFSALAEQMGDSGITANCYNNIGVVYKNLGKRNVASEYFYRALKIFSGQKNNNGIASCYINIASLLEIEGQYDASIEYDIKAEHLFRKARNEFGVITAYINIAEAFTSKEDLKRAAAYYDSAMKIVLAKNDKLHLRDIYDGMYKLYAKKKDFPQAFDYLHKYMDLRDSSFSAENASRAAGLEAKYKMQQSEKEIELLRQNEEIIRLQNTKNKILIGLLAAVALCVAVIAFFMFKRYRQKKEANVLLELHNRAIEHQKKEITDSIGYAKRIQMSILPPDSLVNRLLPDSFVLYKAKDIVSGDFYWVEECDGKVLFAAVDCTGHGVPGAMMSVLGFNLLSQAVNEKKLAKPSAILEHLDYGVDKMLRQSTDENSVRDGMDLSLCCLDYKTGLLEFAGAYNNLWMVKHASCGLEEVKADKMMIGVNAGRGADHFSNHEIQLQKGDTVYIFSDGYADQFGGPSGKKFKYRPMKELLARIHDLPMHEQRSILDDTLEKWRGNLEQVDDILVIGVRY